VTALLVDRHKRGRLRYRRGNPNWSESEDLESLCRTVWILTGGSVFDGRLLGTGVGGECIIVWNKIFLMSTW